MSDTSGILWRAAQGAGWVFAWRMVSRVLGLLSVLVLIRLLAPADFGIVALAFALSATIEALATLGVEAQLIRTRDPSPDLYHTAFTLNAIRGLCLAIVAVALADSLAEFFGDPRLAEVMYAIAVLLVIGGVCSIGVVDFMRNLDFRKEFRLLLVPRLLQAAAGVACALAWRNHWALLAGLLVGRLATLFMGYAMHPYRPRLTLVAWRSLIGVSFWMWAFSIATVARDRIESFAIGRMLGPAPLGIYTTSMEIAALPVTEIVHPISRASTMGFAASLREELDPAEAFLRVFGITFLLALPASIGMSLVAGPVVALAFGPRWHEAAPVIAVLSPALAFVALAMVSTALLTAMLRIRLLFAMTALGACIKGTAVLLAAANFGLWGTATALALAIAVEQGMLAAVTLRVAKVPLRSVLATLWRPIVATAIMAGVLWHAGIGWDPVLPQFLQASLMLLLAIGLGAALFMSSLLALWVLVGRPRGAESDLLVMVQQVFRTFAGREPGPAPAALRHTT
ncbi:MAG TPA: oligosaccharide flippase family protein [Acetobacteraceae bacterium]|nr:oligosaccharide flippase family protein [Acetobacteraceae bacterium]